jgi:hypothetical protein
MPFALTPFASSISPWLKDTFSTLAGGTKIGANRMTAFLIVKDKRRWKLACWIGCFSLLVFAGGSIDIQNLSPSVSDSFNIRREITGITNRIANLQVRVNQAVSMKQEVSQTVNVITKVEKEIANIKEAINQLYSRLRVEVFRPSQVGDQFCGWAYSNKASWVALRLHGCPVQGSVQGIWDNRPLYPTSMRTFENVLVYVFEGSETPTNKIFSVSYMLDPDRTNLFRRLDVRDDTLYIDGRRVERTALP